MSQTSIPSGGFIIKSSARPYGFALTTDVEPDPHPARARLMNYAPGVQGANQTFTLSLLSSDNGNLIVTISQFIDGRTQYLQVDGAGLSLVSDAADATRWNLTPADAQDDEWIIRQAGDVDNILRVFLDQTPFFVGTQRSWDRDDPSYRWQFARVPRTSPRPGHAARSSVLSVAQLRSMAESTQSA